MIFCEKKSLIYPKKKSKLFLELLIGFAYQFLTLNLPKKLTLRFSMSDERAIKFL